MPAKVTRTLAAAALAGLLLCLGACNVVAPVVLAVSGPGNIDREFELDENKSYVVFVDDPSNRVATRRLRLLIGEAAEERVIRRNLVDDGNVIAARSALAATTRDRNDQPLSIAEIGRAVGADAVIYVLVTEFNATPVSERTTPYAAMRVKVVESESASRAWPVTDEAGFAMRISMPGDAAATGATTRSEALRAQRQLAERVGLGIAQLFYTVELPQSVRR